MFAKPKCVVCGQECSVVQLRLDNEPVDIPVVCEAHHAELKENVLVINPRFGWYLYVPREKYPDIWRKVLRSFKNCSDDLKKEPLPGFMPPMGVIVCPQMYYMDILAKDMKNELGCEADKELRSLEHEADELQSEIAFLQDDLEDVERKIERYPMLSSEHYIMAEQRKAQKAIIAAKKRGGQENIAACSARIAELQKEMGVT